MVASNANVAILAQKLDAFPGIRAITYHISQAPYLVNLTPLLQILQHCLEGGQVAVDIG